MVDSPTRMCDMMPKAKHGDFEQRVHYYPKSITVPLFLVFVSLLLVVLYVLRTGSLVKHSKGQTACHTLFKLPAQHPQWICKAKPQWRPSSALLSREDTHLPTTEADPPIPIS